MRRTVNLAIVVAMQILLVVLFVAYMAPAPTVQADTMRACPNDSDSRNCVWDARHMGNGAGHSYVASRTGKITYISHQRAHRLLGL